MESKVPRRGVRSAPREETRTFAMARAGLSTLQCFAVSCREALKSKEVIQDQNNVRSPLYERFVLRREEGKFPKRPQERFLCSVSVTTLLAECQEMFIVISIPTHVTSQITDVRVSVIDSTRLDRERCFVAQPALFLRFSHVLPQLKELVFHLWCTLREASTLGNR